MSAIGNSSYSITVEAEAHLDDFEVEDIIAYCVEHKLAIPGTGPSDAEEATSEIERLYYATRGDGPLTPQLVDDIRALLRTLAGRA